MPGNDATTDPKSPQRFEEHLSAVEAAVRRLESGDIPLEDSIDLYAGAMEHLRACHVVLDRAEKRLDIVRKSAATGALESVPAELREPDGVVPTDAKRG